MGLGPPVTRRRPIGAVVVAVAAVVLAVVIGVIIAVNRNSSQHSSQHSVATLKAVLDTVPLPAGAVLVHETADEQQGDANAYVERRYRLPAHPTSSEQVRSALVHAGCRLVDLQSGQTSPVASADWVSLVLPTSGDLKVLPRGTTGGGIELSWKGDALYLSVKGGDAQLG